ncbi:MAG: putative dual-specificity RNA methyltransferase RlmN [Dehalococcoidia bacterium]|nr:MAG: putative dual-specificity RNA methyltransferase RlmN [Dehalococcoidia bacterium]
MNGQERPTSPRSWLDTPEEELAQALRALGQPAYRLKQVQHWVYRQGVLDFAQMSDLPQELRAALAERFVVAPLRVVRTLASADGWTTKYLLELPGGVSPGRKRPLPPATVETVLMRYDPTDSQRGRWTACLSSQAGCAVGCPFCATGQAGFFRQLTAGEIVGQLLVLNAALRARGERVTNVVLMGQGEPLLNVAAVWQAIERIHDPAGLAIGARHITISTVGIVPAIEELAERQPPVRLAVSLHAPNDELRTQLVPINRRYPLAQLLAACQRFSARTGRRVTFEYALIAGVNDSVALARELVRRIAPIPCHVNLIPVNPTPGSHFQRPAPDQVRAFQAVLHTARIPTTVRVERGIDIFAGCGQLRAEEVSTRQAVAAGR